MQIKVNLNDKVSVRLTAAGEAAWARSWKQTSPQGVPDCIRDSATNGEWVTFQLWELMNTFGPLCLMGFNGLPFVNNEVRFE
jgi:hypothetical protein